MIIIHCNQGDDAWHSARAGVITASMFGVARKRLKSGPNKGDFTSEAKDYAFRLAIERISGEPLDEGFVTWQMRRGNELEPDARSAHEMAAGVFVERCGFVMTDDGVFGASADGLIGIDGGSEYKCLVSPERLRDVLIDEDLSDFADQVQGCLWLTGRKFWHYALYCPALKSIGKELWWREWKRDEAYIEQLEVELLQFKKLVDDCEAKLRDVRTSPETAASASALNPPQLPLMPRSVTRPSIEPLVIDSGPRAPHTPPPIQKHQGLLEAEALYTPKTKKPAPVVPLVATEDEGEPF